MSDSELSAEADLPADTEIEQCLRRVVHELTRKPDLEVTTNVVRSHAEKELGLDTDFFKHNPDWKSRSKDIIAAAVQEDEDEDETSSPEKPAPKPKVKPLSKAGTKRKSDDEEAPRKKRMKKTAPVADSEDELSVSDQDAGEPRTKPARKSAKTSTKKATSSKSADVVESDDENDDADAVAISKEQTAKDESELLDVPNDIEGKAVETNGQSAKADDDESDLSSLIDEPPPKKKRQKSSEPKSKAKAGAKGTKTAKPKAAGKDLAPGEEEVKRLQGWLVKCGVRKLWHKELASCSTSKEKIKHLKGMLNDVGMTGRYSAEKARQIKESRELAEEIEAAKEYNQRWGKEKDEDGDDQGASNDDEGGSDAKGDTQPKKRLPKGFVDFGDSGDDGSD